jgi:hypothetical protein
VPISRGPNRQSVRVMRWLRWKTSSSEDTSLTVVAEADLLASLVGQIVESIVFVMDYVQVTLWGPHSTRRLTMFVWPRVEAFAETWVHGDRGYRDALCSLIGQTVVAAGESHVTGLTLRLDHAALSINPELGDLSGPEIAMLQMNDDESRWAVWRPGEGPFAGRDW